jgi:hypothetical protein
MSEQITHYREDHLSLYQVNSNYTLLLQMQAETFSYAVVYQNRLVAWAKDCPLNELNNPGDEHDLLIYTYEKVVVGLPSTGFTLVPNAVFSEDHIADFARFLDVQSSEKIFTEVLDSKNLVIYKCAENMIPITEKFGLQKTVFNATGWISLIAKNYPSEDNLYLNMDHKQVGILYFAQGKLRFYNTFEFNNPDELVYFAAFVAQELQLQPKSINLILSGHISLEDKNAARLSGFFNGVELNDLEVIDLPAQIKSNQILSLAALSLCVSSEVY